MHKLLHLTIRYDFMVHGSHHGQMVYISACMQPLQPGSGHMLPPPPPPVSDDYPAWWDEVWASPLDVRRRIFCNRSLNMAHIKASHLSESPQLSACSATQVIRERLLSAATCNSFILIISSWLRCCRPLDSTWTTLCHSTDQRHLRCLRTT